MASGDEKAVHLRLAGVVKGVHAKLRSKYKQSAGDHEAAWLEHCLDKDTLSEYAAAMHKLATEIWIKNNPETRIDWCRKTCHEYFREGGLQKVLDKEARRQKFRSLRNEGGDFCGKSGIFSSDTSCAGNKGNDATCQLYLRSAHKELQRQTKDSTNPDSACSDIISERLDVTKTSNYLGNASDLAFGSHCQTSVFSAANEESGNTILLSCQPCQLTSDFSSEAPSASETSCVILPSYEGLLRLLDVGSCYNPFQEFEEFLAVGIDISPAVETVYKGDLLAIEVTDPLGSTQEALESHLHGLHSPVASLPADSFHVVVFSLLLEYMPAPLQRWSCCQKAHQLLARNGLLIIMTPDSHHQNRNAPMMKSWRRAIESLGFARWRYAKQEHLHCLAFRKVPRSDTRHHSDVAGGDIGPGCLYIPQDFNTDISEDDDAVCSPKNEVDVVYDFDLLPGLDSLDE